MNVNANTTLPADQASATSFKRAAPKPAGPSPLFANDAWFSTDIPTVGEPVGGGTGNGPVVGNDGTAPGGRVVGGHAGVGEAEDDGRGGIGGFFHRMFAGSGSGN